MSEVEEDIINNIAVDGEWYRKYLQNLIIEAGGIFLLFFEITIEITIKYIGFLTFSGGIEMWHC